MAAMPEPVATLPGAWRRQPQVLQRTAGAPAEAVAAVKLHWAMQQGIAEAALEVGPLVPARLIVDKGASFRKGVALRRRRQHNCCTASRCRPLVSLAALELLRGSS